MTSHTPASIVTYLCCFLVAYFATGIGEGLFVATAMLSFNSSDSTLALISLGIFLLVPTLAFLIGGLILFRIIAGSARAREMQGGWKRKFALNFILLSGITLALNYVLAIYLPGTYLKPLEGVISYCLEHAPDW